MIANLPTASDYFLSGKELFNFAWDATSKLLIDLDQAADYGIEKSEVSAGYWLAARRTLTTSLTIVQQGVELILKGKIAEISPYLLISDPPSRWPTLNSTTAIDFSRFRTVDSQDLVRVLDTFSPTQLGADFVARFNALRERRNVIMHSAGSSINIGVAEVVETILYMHKALFPTENWATIRREFLRNSPDSELGGGEYATNGVCWEVSLIKDMLDPAQMLAFMGIDKKQRSYLCPECLDDANTDDGFKFKLAVLRPKSSTATRLYCPICNTEHAVIRQACEQDGCPGNVIAAEEAVCLTCGH